MKLGVIGVVIGFIVFGIAIYFAWKEWSWLSFLYIGIAIVFNKFLSSILIKKMAKEDGVNL